MWRTGLGVCKCPASRSPHSSAAAGRSGIRGLLGSSGRRNPPGGKLRGFTVLGEPGVADSHLGPGASLGPDGLRCGPAVVPGGAGTVGSQTVAQAACGVAESRGGAGGGVQAWWLHGTPAVPSPASLPLDEQAAAADSKATRSRPNGRNIASRTSLCEKAPHLGTTAWNSLEQLQRRMEPATMGLKSAWSHVFTRRSKRMRDRSHPCRWPGVLSNIQPASRRPSKLPADALVRRPRPSNEAMLKAACCSKGLGRSGRSWETGRLA
jgi:hypothetical protein